MENKIEEQQIEQKKTEEQGVPMQCFVLYDANKPAFSKQDYNSTCKKDGIVYIDAHLFTNNPNIKEIKIDKNDTKQILFHSSTGRKIDLWTLCSFDKITFNAFNLRMLSLALETHISLYNRIIPLKS